MTNETSLYYLTLGLLASFIAVLQSEIASQRGVDIGIALGSISGSLGDSIGAGDGGGSSSGVSTVPLFVCNTPPESITSSTL